MEVSQRQQTLAEIAQERQRLEKQLREIAAEQGRIRANLEQIDDKSDLYARYVRKLASQEDEIESINKEVKELESDESEKRSALGDFILGLDWE